MDLKYKESKEFSSFLLKVPYNQCECLISGILLISILTDCNSRQNNKILWNTINGRKAVCYISANDVDNLHESPGVSKTLLVFTDFTKRQVNTVKFLHHALSVCNVCNRCLLSFPSDQWSSFLVEHCSSRLVNCLFSSFLFLCSSRCAGVFLSCLTSFIFEDMPAIFLYRVPWPAIHKHLR